MKILKAKLSTLNTEIFQISDLAFVKHGFVLEDILNGADMLNPIDCLLYTSPSPRDRG